MEIILYCFNAIQIKSFIISGAYQYISLSSPWRQISLTLHRIVISSQLFVRLFENLISLM